MLGQFTEWLAQLVREAFSALWQFVVDVFIALVDLVVGAVVGLASLIPVPEFLSTGLGSLFGQLDSGIVYIVAASGLPAGLAILGTGYAFRLVRKVVTLFQW